MASENTPEGPLEHLFLRWLQAAYSSEKKVAQHLPQLIARSGQGPLRQVLLIHLEKADDRIDRLERIFERIDEKAGDGPCTAISAVLAEGEDAIDGISDDATCETAVVAVARTIAAHEIARYRALLTWSKALGREDCTDLLEQSLAEEISTDEMLRKAAEERQNRSA